MPLLEQITVDFTYSTHPCLTKEFTYRGCSRLLWNSHTEIIAGYCRDHREVLEGCVELKVCGSSSKVNACLSLTG